MDLQQEVHYTDDLVYRSKADCDGSVSKMRPDFDTGNTVVVEAACTVANIPDRSSARASGEIEVAKTPSVNPTPTECVDTCCALSKTPSSEKQDKSRCQRLSLAIDDLPRNKVRCTYQDHSTNRPRQRDDTARSFRSSAEVDYDCCVGKPKPCCNEDCVELLAIRECDIECIENNRSNDEPTFNAQEALRRGQFCCPSGTTARKFYLALLKSLGCLCQTIRDRGEPTCCTVSRRSSFRCQKGGRPNGHTEQKIDNCCPVKSVASTDNQKCDATGQHHSHRSMNVDARANSEYHRELSPSNLESGIATVDHVILSVSGMTCVGCETKLQRSFATIKSVSNVKTSLILCRAEFDLDLRHSSAESIIRHLQRTTEFNYERLETNGSEIEVCPFDVTDFIRQELPFGVSSIRLVDKKVVCISYDPSIVGARDLVQNKFGSAIPLAPVKPDPSLAAGSKHVRHVGLVTVCSVVFTVPVLVLSWAPINSNPVIIDSISLVLATLVQFVIAGPFYLTALKSLIFARTIEMELLIVISTSAAYIFSVISFGYEVAGHPLATDQFFETSTLLVTLIMVGRWLSAMARQRAVESVSIRSLQTSTAMLISDNSNESDREIDTRLLQYGDSFSVAPESRIPTDGTIVSGNSEVDESLINGESLPVQKRPGNIVIAGSMNGSGVLIVRLNRLPGSNSISAIASMVDEAKLSKPMIQNTADAVAKYFVPTAIGLGVCTFIVWILVGLKSEGKGGSQAVIQALTYGITVIIVSCPCAIGLAIPMVIVIAGGVAARHGCVFKTASTIEIARRTSHVVFDKTGTLTQGKLTVSMVKYFGVEEYIAAAIHATVGLVKHPVSIAVTKHLRHKTLDRVEASDVSSHTGKGVEGRIGTSILKAGNSRWLGVHEHPEVQHFLLQGYTTFCVTINDELSAIFGLDDCLRPDAIETVAELQRRSIEVIIVSGDDEGAVSTVARRLNITNSQSRCTSASKADFMKKLVEDGQVTIFCGDGTNDAAALAQSTIGVHINEGTDVAQSAADVVLVRSSLTGILTLIDLSRASMLRIVFNFAWSFVYNVVAILFASGILVHVRIPPAYAGLGELVSVLPVILIALQLRWAKFSNVVT